MISLDIGQNLDLLSVGIAIAASVLLGYKIYFENRNSATGKTFFAFTLVSSGWGIVNYLSYQFSSPVWLLWLTRLVLFFAVWQAFTFFLLSYIFPEDKITLPKWIVRYLTPAVVLVSLLTLSPYVVKVIDGLNQSGTPVFIPGMGIAVFGIFAVSLVAAGLFYLVRRILKTPKAERLQLRYFTWGTVLMFLAIICFNLILPAIFNQTDFIPFGAIFILPFVFFTGYSILKHGLFNIKIFSTEVLVLVLIVVNLFEIITSKGIYDLIFRVFIFFTLLLVGILLIRSVQQEAKQRQELELLSGQLKTANIQLKEVDKAKSEFLSVASHQLRTPLTAIKGYASMILSGDFGPVEKTQKDSVQIIFDSAQRLAVLVGDLLDLSRIESGRMEFDFDAVNVCEIIESVITEISQKAKDKGLYLYFDNINRSCPEIRADAEKLRQVIINLIDNSIKYTPKGGVTLTLMKVGEMLQFSVKDTGIGVDPAEKSKLFEKFFRTTAANELTREGTGLGIYVVKKIVESHGGTISFDSPGVNQGTTFTVTFPIPKGKIIAERVKIDAMDAF
ncbi:MAG: multi-sensor signal transduction histidine kinase [Candidatus Doudnabacteria bacterium]|nr:multi-sensor signal transduction histidine kinase [Candidatus Doudnabacteria bacterium]